MGPISLTSQLDMTKTTTLEGLYQSIQILMDTLPHDTKVFAKIKGEIATQITTDSAYPFLDEDFFDDDEVPADLSENHDKYLYG